MMRWRVLKIVGWIAATALVYLFIKSGNDAELGGPTVLVGEPNEDGLRSLCQYLEDPVQGVEGRGVDAKTWRLRGLAITFRHGERSPILTDGGVTDCTPFRDVDRKTFEVYTRLIESDDFAYFLKVDPRFEELGFQRVPERSLCGGGKLTAEGALQHSRLGTYMHRRYAPSSLFAADAHVNLSVAASPYERTMQSAVAFLSGFVYPTRAQFPQVYLKHSPTTFFCMDACECAEGKAMRRRYEKEHVEYFLTRSPASLRETVGRLIDGVAVMRDHHMKDPLEVLDVLLGRHMCRRAPLPCTLQGHCASHDLIKEMYNETTVRGDVMFSQRIGVAARLQVAEAYPILSEVVAAARRLKHFPHTDLIKIFSGHDVTVGPLMRVMGIQFMDFPHYTSRIVFEIYEKIGAERDVIYMRILYNGEDRTGEARFCPPSSLVDGLCPASRLEKFLEREVFTLAGRFSSYADVCGK